MPLSGEGHTQEEKEGDYKIKVLFEAHKLANIKGRMGKSGVVVFDVIV